MQTAAMESALEESETLQTWAAGATLFHEGDEALGVYVLRSGRADLLFGAGNGNVTPLRMASAGQILGLSAVVMRRPYECSAITRTRCEIGFVDRDTLLRSLEDTPTVWFGLLHVLSNEVNAAYDEMRSLSRR